MLSTAFSQNSIRPSSTAIRRSPVPYIETKDLPIKDENGHSTTFGELAKRYRHELEGRSRYHKTRWWDLEREEQKWRNKRRHRSL